MHERDDLGKKLAEFVNKVSHTRGRTLTFMTEANVTVTQAILMDHVLNGVAATPSELSDVMGLSLSSASQMIDRLVKFGFLERFENPDDRRRKTIIATAAARQFLEKLQNIRVTEFEAGISGLSPTTRDLLRTAIMRALEEVPTRRPRSKDR
jgi:DNA-binding MarR family transcriptional regulator